MAKKQPRKQPARALTAAERRLRYSQLQVWLSMPPEDIARLRRAAELERRPLANFVAHHCMLAVEKIEIDNASAHHPEKT